MNPKYFIVLIWTILVQHNAAFQSGFDYIYQFESKIDHKSQDISLNYSSKLDLLVQKNNHLVVLKVVGVDGNFGFTQPLAKNLIEYPIAFEYENGSLKNTILVDENDSQASIWLKKSILNMFDFGIDQTKKDDFFARCDTSTQILTNSSDILHLKKYKFNCENNFRLKGQHLRDQKILNTKIDRDIKSEVIVVKSCLNSSTSVENVQIFNELNPSVSNFIKIEKSLILSSIEKTSRNFDQYQLQIERDMTNLVHETINYDAKISGLSYDPEEKTKIEKFFDKELRKTVKALKLGTLETSETFLNTIKQIRKYLHSNSKLLDKIFKDSTKKQKNFKFLLEAYLSSGVEAALSSVSKALDIENLKTDDKILGEKESKLIEQFLFYSSLMSHQNHKANQLIRIINSNWNKLTLFDIRDKSILALGYHSDQKYLEEARSQILLCKSETCVVTLLESVRNSKSDQIEELFLERIISNCSKQPLVCLISIKTFNYLDIGTRKDIFFLLFEIFTSNLLDKDIRIEALNVLADKYPNEMAENEDVFKNFIHTIQLEIKKNQKTNEFLIFIQKLIFNKPNLREKLIHYLNQSSLVNQFDFLVQNGFSNSMSSSIKSYPSGILGYNLNQLMSDDGYLRNFDFSVSFKQNNSSRLDFLKVELYADNLSSFSAKLKQKKEERKDPTSSLHLSIMGQKLKIVELFKGYASMISMLWALPTSLTSLFNSNFLVNDQIEYIFLSNGMSLRIENMGTLGIDIEGVTDVSLWNQYAKINLKTRASFINEQNLILINNFNILNTFHTSLKTQFLVDFDMNTDFNHDPYQLCVKMSQNKFQIRESSKVLDGEKKILQEINKILPIQGSGFMFSRETVKFC